MPYIAIHRHFLPTRIHIMMSCVTVQKDESVVGYIDGGATTTTNDHSFVVSPLSSWNWNLRSTYYHVWKHYYQESSRPHLCEIWRSVNVFGLEIDGAGAIEWATREISKRCWRTSKEENKSIAEEKREVLRPLLLLLLVDIFIVTSWRRIDGCQYKSTEASYLLG